MIGDQQDMLVRLKAALPAGWFADSTPVLDAVLQGPGWSWSWAYGALDYVRKQARLATTTDVWLDVAARDLFGSRVSRRGQGDVAFRAQIRREVLRERGTRAAVVSVLTDITGRQPTVFEPARSSDTGAWGQAGGLAVGLAYGAAGGWGSLALPYQAFVTAYRPSGSGIANVAGWSAPAGGYGAGAIEYGDLSMTQTPVTDADIYAAVASVMPVAAVAWTRISN